MGTAFRWNARPYSDWINVLPGRLEKLVKVIAKPPSSETGIMDALEFPPTALHKITSMFVHTYSTTSVKIFFSGAIILGSTRPC